MFYLHKLVIEENDLSELYCVNEEVALGTGQPGDLAVDTDFAAVSFPEAVGPLGDENFGRIAVFKITNTPVLYRIVEGGIGGQEIGRVLSFRKTQLTGTNVVAYELFYDNWMFVNFLTQTQIKIGRLTIFYNAATDDGQTEPLTHLDPNAFVPVNGVMSSGETESSFSIFGERIFFKKKNDLHM
jgi:hypothetical protein